VRRYAVPAFVVVATVFVMFRLLALYPWSIPGADLAAYWATRDGLDYGAQPGASGAYLYSPAFAQVIRPLAALPWPAFSAAWSAMLLAVLGWLGGRAAILLVLLPPVAMSIGFGNVDLVMAAVVVVGFRFPAAWSFALLTKVTPGLGLLWFLVRREWYSLWLALAATIGITAVSAALDPAGWGGWLRMLQASQAPQPDAGLFLPVSLWLRLGVATTILVWGARTDRRWTVAVAMALAMPIDWITVLAVLVALVPLLGHGPAASLALGPAPRPFDRRWSSRFRRPTAAIATEGAPGGEDGAVRT
jgi:hypothetical protein